MSSALALCDVWNVSGASGELWSDATKICKSSDVGLLIEFSTYKAEVIGIILALHLLRHLDLKDYGLKMTQQITATIMLNNKGIIQTIQKGKTAKPEQYIFTNIIITTQKLIHDYKINRNTNLKLWIRWKAGHVGTKGNEQADQLAKEASKGNTSPDYRLPDILRNNVLPASISAR